jgi:hypothetical protein
MTGSYGEPSATPSSAPYSVAGQRSMTAGEVSRESGLREDLVVRFVPTVETPNGPLYGTRQLAIANVVRQLTDIGTPASTVVAAVEDLNARADNEVPVLAGPSRRGHPTRPTRRWAAVAAAAIIALVIGGLAVGLFTKSADDGDRVPPAATSTVTVPASPQPLQPAIPATTDPVCAQWAPMTSDNIAKRADWSKTDPNIPASQWSPQQRAITMNVIPIMRQEASDLRGLAARANDPTLRFLMQLQALYNDAFADRLPNYTPPNDQRLWVAATDAGNMINSLCNAVAPPK